MTGPLAGLDFSSFCHKHQLVSEHLDPSSCVIPAVDKKYEAVIIPLFGIATPFHISTIKVSWKCVMFTMRNCCLRFQAEFSYFKVVGDVETILNDDF